MSDVPDKEFEKRISILQELYAKDGNLKLLDSAYGWSRELSVGSAQSTINPVTINSSKKEFTGKQEVSVCCFV